MLAWSKRIASTDISAMEHEKVENIWLTYPTSTVSALVHGHILVYGVSDLNIAAIKCEQFRQGARALGVRGTKPSDRLQEDFAYAT